MLEIFLEILFWTCLFLIIHSYVIYPIVLFVFSRTKNDNRNIYEINEVPHVSIIIAAHNEEKLISEKINSIFKTYFPKDKIELIIGSDASTDNTNLIINEFCQKYSNIDFTLFSERQGKASILNQLVKKAKSSLVIFTDANVIFSENTIYELVKHFKNANIGLVDSRMTNSGLSKSGISIQESIYIAREVTIKYHESIIWGTMMGPFGGAFAIRKELYSDIPKNFLMDDFYLNMKVLESGKFSINNLNAIVFEDVSNLISEEFRRKVRISIGNFQNLKAFRSLFKFFSVKHPFPVGLLFCFISHKILRWFTPLFILTTFIISIYLSNRLIYFSYLIFICFTIFLIIIDQLLYRIKIHIIILRFITHFYSMNLALLIGLFKFLKGVKSNVWEPTKRKQTE